MKQSSDSILPPKFNTQLVKSVLTRGCEIKGETIVVKLPETIIMDAKSLSNFADNVCLLNSIGVNIIIIQDHGQIKDGKSCFFGNEIFKNFPDQSLNSYRKTVITEMILSGYINKKIVSILCSSGCLAIGISGKDGSLIVTKPSKRYHNVKDYTDNSIIDLQFINKPTLINPEVILSFEDAGLVPVISPVATGPNNSTYIVDSDISSAMIASSLAAKYLILFTNHVPPLEPAQYNLEEFKKTYTNNTKEGVDKKIMQAASYSLDNNVDQVKIISSYSTDALIKSVILNLETIQVTL